MAEVLDSEEFREEVRSDVAQARATVSGLAEDGEFCGLEGGDPD